MLTQQKLFLSKCHSIIVMENGKVVESGPYNELKKRNVNFSGWVTDVIHYEDDPEGIFNNINELKLDNTTSTEPNFDANPLKLNSSNFGKSPFERVRKKSAKPRSSPLAVARPINAEEKENNKQHVEGAPEFSETFVPSPSINVDEHAISKLIERNQNSVLTGSIIRPPANFVDQDILSRTIEANQLTAQSIHHFEISSIGTIERVKTTPLEKFTRGRPGLLSGLFFLMILTAAHAFRFACDIWLTFIVDEKDDEARYNQNFLIFVCLSVAIIISILLRGFGLLQVIVSHGSKWHDHILDVI
jgi:hypothetical protein